MTKEDNNFTGNIIVPYNPKKYDLEKALSLFDYIEWGQHARPEIGGSVYLYVGKAGGELNGQSLAYQFEVLDVDSAPTIDDSCCNLVPNAFNNKGKFFRMKLVRRIPHGLITLDDLKANGLKKHPQSQMKVSCELQEFIDSVLK